MRARPLHTLILSLCLSPSACRQVEPSADPEPAAAEPLPQVAGADPTSGGPSLAAPLAGATTPNPEVVANGPGAAGADDDDDSAGTLTWPMTALKLEVDADRADAFALAGTAIAFAGRADEHVRVARFVPDATPGARPGATTAAATLDGGPIGDDPVTLSNATRERPALAVWHDADGVIWSVPVDEHLADAKPQKIMDPLDPTNTDPDGKALGAVALAAADDGTLACTGIEGRALHCAMLDAAGRTDGWTAVGKAPDLQAESLVAGPSGGWLLLASECKPRSAETCKRKDLVVVRLGPDGMPPRKKPTLPLPEVETRRGGLVIVPTATGFLLVARRYGAGEAAAWRVSESAVKELDGKFSRVMGGLDGEDGLVLIEQAPLAMIDGHPIARHRPRPLDAHDEREDPLKWPATVDALVPKTVDQRVISGESHLVFVEPIRKRHVRATVVRLGRAAGG